MSDYVPFGDEWIANVMTMRKADIVDLLKLTCEQKLVVEDENKRLREGLQATESSMEHDQACDEGACPKCRLMRLIKEVADE